MKKGIVAGLIVLCVALGAGTAAVVVTDDRKGPEIELPADGDVTYAEGSDTAPLLEGVTATDEKDGDVTDSLMIENIFPNDDHTSASVVYAAKDSHNNVSKATRRVNYKAAAEDTPAEMRLRRKRITVGRQMSLHRQQRSRRRMTQRAQKMRQMRRWKSKHCRRKAQNCT